MKRITILLIATTAFAASEMQGPSLGWIWDRDAKSLRQLAGLPGALRNEAGVDLGEGVRAVWLSPTQNEALVARDGGLLERRNLLNGETVRLEVEAPDSVIYSPDGKQLGLWWKSAGRFAIWGEASRDLVASRIVLTNDAELISLESDGVLRSSRGAWLGTFGAGAAIALASNRLAVAGNGVVTLFEKTADSWTQRSRREDARIDAWSQIEFESVDSLLAVNAAHGVERWSLTTGETQTLADTGVTSLSRLRQPGFYLAEGDTLRLMFALSESQRLYALPAGEVR